MSKSIFFSSLRCRLLLLVLFAVIPAVGFIFYTSVEQRQHAAAMAQEDALRLAHLASNDQARLIGETRQFLTTLASLPEVRDFNSQACSGLFAGILKQYPLYANLGAIMPNGDLFCSGLPVPAPINLADRAYFRRTVETRSFAIGDYQIGRVTKKATINFGYPVLDKSGELQAVLFAALDLAWVDRIVSEANLPTGSTFTVIDQNGTILARYPEPEKWVGQKTPEPVMARGAQARRTGVAEAAGAGGVSYLFGFAPLLSTGQAGDVYVSIGIPKEVALAPANRVLIRNLTSLGLVGLLALAAAWVGSDVFILRRVHALVEATRRLAAGDIRARTGLPHDNGELGQLARSFDGMAESLERRYQQLKALHEIDVAITSTLDLHDILAVLLEKIDLFLPYATATVRLFNKESGVLEPVACRNLDEKEWKLEQWKAGRGPANLVFETKAPMMIRNCYNDPRVKDPAFFRKHALVSYLGVPMVDKEKILGVLSFYTKEEHDFSNEEVEFLSTLVGQAAIAIHNSRLYEEVREKIQELQQKTADLERANKVKDEFLSIMSHELRTPLNVVMGYTGMIKDRLLGEINPEQEKALEKVISRARDQLAMINSILQATQIEAEGVKVESQELNLHDFLDNLRLNYELPSNKEVSLIWDYPPDLPAVKTDGEKLEHILRNLINNALKFTANGHVTVTAQYLERESMLEFKVADTGVGIQAEALPFIFERFHQVDSSETRPYGGVGIGLYIVKKLTELLGGTIKVESEPGKGSTFTVSLPAETVEEVKRGDD